MTRLVQKSIALIAIVAVVPRATVAAETPRKIKSQVPPVVPDIARHMNLKGTVRLEIEIGADGLVKSAKALGGHPVLIQSAEDAVHKWRYEPGPPTKTVIEFNFRQD
jgi:protein TonB